MSTPIETTGPNSQSIYAVIFNEETGEVWNTTLNAGDGGWEAFNGGHWAQYAVPLTEYGSTGYYRGAYPANIFGVMTSEVLYNNPTPTLGDAPYAGPGQSQGANVAAVAGNALVPATLRDSLRGMTAAAIMSGTLSVRAFSTTLTNPEANAYKGRGCYFATGVLAGQAAIISSYDPDTGILTVAGGYSAAPSAGDLFVIS